MPIRCERARCQIVEEVHGSQGKDTFERSMRLQSESYAENLHVVHATLTRRKKVRRLGIAHDALNLMVIPVMCAPMAKWTRQRVRKWTRRSKQGRYMASDGHPAQRRKQDGLACCRYCTQVGFEYQGPVYVVSVVYKELVGLYI